MSTYRVINKFHQTSSGNYVHSENRNKATSACIMFVLLKWLSFQLAYFHEIFWKICWENSSSINQSRAKSTSLEDQ